MPNTSVSSLLNSASAGTSSLSTVEDIQGADFSTAEFAVAISVWMHLAFGLLVSAESCTCCRLINNVLMLLVSILSKTNVPHTTKSQTRSSCNQNIWDAASHTSQNIIAVCSHALFRQYSTTQTGAFASSLSNMPPSWSLLSPLGESRLARLFTGAPLEPPGYSVWYCQSQSLLDEASLHTR